MFDVESLRIQFITDNAGQRIGVILPINAFEELLEDLEDLAVVAERRDEPTLSHEELLASLRQDGLL
ncbi:MAG: hypothetical protein HY706_11060 [Candidatus Hydrogenedentes bacterium]|nr:hypothetical protein [Candidatus Hydrogenedentota bacterium]